MELWILTPFALVLVTWVFFFIVYAYGVGKKVKSLFKRKQLVPPLVSNPPAYDIALQNHRRIYKDAVKELTDIINKKVNTAISLGCFEKEVATITLISGKISRSSYVSTYNYVDAGRPSYPTFKKVIKKFTDRGLKVKLTRLSYDETQLIVTLTWYKPKGDK